MTEKLLWNTVKHKLGSYGKFERIENPLSPGMPDVVFCVRNAIDGTGGFIELKSIVAAPHDVHRRGNPIKLRPAQNIWIQDWKRAGGVVWILIRIGKPRRYMLLNGTYALHMNLSCATWSELLGIAYVYNGPEFPTREMLDQLKG